MQDSQGFSMTQNTRHSRQFAIGHPINMCGSPAGHKVIVVFTGHPVFRRPRLKSKAKITAFPSLRAELSYPIFPQGSRTFQWWLPIGWKKPPGSLIPPLLPSPIRSSAKKRKGKKVISHCFIDWESLGRVGCNIGYQGSDCAIVSACQRLNCHWGHTGNV